jgi:hypothetical protein
MRDVDVNLGSDVNTIADDFAPVGADMGLFSSGREGGKVRRLLRSEKSAQAGYFLHVDGAVLERDDNAKPRCRCRARSLISNTGQLPDLQRARRPIWLKVEFGDVSCWPACGQRLAAAPPEPWA